MQKPVCGECFGFAEDFFVVVFIHKWQLIVTIVFWSCAPGVPENKLSYHHPTKGYHKKFCFDLPFSF